MDVELKCKDCGERHRTGREAIECDLRLGKQPPGVVAAHTEHWPANLVDRVEALERSHR